ncbi:hypothetical protein [Streptomyces sp. SID4985]|uniref:hypothetical protein n=1 Tax=unclassified Streptomyces TaxID=2593676 RepID=UPI00136EBEA2|nr:hypothetical protein [Streptomyces sp. SID4985]MYQ46209.1 hypothetical protein [Streptomyces sp. SID4985]
MLTTQGDEGSHPGLTIKVYRVNPETGQRTVVRPTRHVQPARDIPFSQSFPPCACPRHQEDVR